MTRPGFRRGNWPIAVAVILAVSACSGSRGPAVQAPVELAIAPIASGPSARNASGESSGERGRTCVLRLVASPIQMSDPNCFLDEHISEGPGLLRYPCSGDGPAEARFGADHYVGRMQGADLALELSSELDWEGDHCRWGTRASINGMIAMGGKPGLMKLAWGYRDFVVSGTSCSGACTAWSSIAVKPTKPSRDVRPHANEDKDEDGDGDEDDMDSSDSD